MDQQLSSLVNRWVDEYLPRLNSRNPVNYHIDQLVGHTVAQEDSLTIAQQAFVALMDRMQHSNRLVKPVLVITLTQGDTTVTRAVPQSTEEVERQLDIGTPPVICLVEWESYLHMLDWEEYTCPLDSSILKDVPADCHVYYREYRSVGEREQGEPFTRAIFCEYFPEFYR